MINDEPLTLVIIRWGVVYYYDKHKGLTKTLFLKNCRNLLHVDICRLMYLIKLSDAVLMPYIFGTNSGILSLCLGLKKGIVLSNIEMFVDYKEFSGLNFFEANNAEDLRNLLFKIQQADGDLLDISEYQLQDYKNEFRMQLLQFFKNLENNRFSVK